MRKTITASAFLALLLSAAPLRAQSSPAAAPALSAAQVRERAALLRDKDLEVRLRAASELGRAGTAAARRALVAELGREKSPYIRARIVDALGERPDKDGTAELVKIARGDKDADARQAAVKALAFSADPAAAAELLARFADADEEMGVRLRAADSLTRYQTDAVFAAFTAALDDADGRIRTQAVVSLYNGFGYDRPRVRPYLERMADDPSAGGTAKLYLERLGR
ncbi:MAG: HEAT repeat domain-containing protein [Elusimicrobiales bacterium]|nr:HEAT repeat domain-containing protein [Elusimicrobiales bacterium]